MGVWTVDFMTSVTVEAHDEDEAIMFGWDRLEELTDGTCEYRGHEGNSLLNLEFMDPNAWEE